MGLAPVRLRLCPHTSFLKRATVSNGQKKRASPLRGRGPSADLSSTFSTMPPMLHTGSVVNWRLRGDYPARPSDKARPRQSCQVAGPRWAIWMLSAARRHAHFFLSVLRDLLSPRDRI